MRRFSKRHSLVTLSDINITPLLDLAFVLLIIFIIAAPAMVENTMDLDLPEGGEAPKELSKEDIRVIEINARGQSFLDQEEMSPAEIGDELGKAFADNPNLTVYIRADGNGRVRQFAAVVNECQRQGIRRYAWATKPEP